MRNGNFVFSIILTWDKKMEQPLVTTDWLEDNLNNKNVIVLDTSMQTVVGKEPIIYQSPLFIPQSQKMDLEGVFTDLSSEQIHAFPTQEQFTRESQKLGINSDSIVVLYDNQGIYSAPRAWWIFRAMGHKKSYVLDGGLPKWTQENRPTIDSLGALPLELGDIQGHLQDDRVYSSREVFSKLESTQHTVIDARGAGRFHGNVPEPREGVRGGHIPGSVNLPFAQVLNGLSYKTSHELTLIFSALLNQQDNTLIYSCGSGITACIILLAAELAGYNDNILYDGSWAEWGSDARLPISVNGNND